MATNDSAEFPLEQPLVSDQDPAESVPSPEIEMLEKYRRNPRVKYVRVVVFGDCCPACRAVEGAYEKDAAPPLPVEACSHPLGCRCSYLPFLTDIYP